MTPRSWLLSYTTHAVLPSGWKTMRLGLPAPSLIVPVTSNVFVSTIDTESPLVFVMYRLAAAAGPAAIRMVTSVTMRRTNLTRSSSRSLLDRGEHHERWRPTHGESYRVARRKRRGNRRRGQSE